MGRPLVANPSAACLKSRKYRESHPNRQYNAEKQRIASLKWRNANLEKARQAWREFIKRYPHHNREKMWRRQGIKLRWDDFLALLTAQEYRCANDGCGVKLSQSSPVDHDHISGAIRGILCLKCNAAIGMVGDSQEKLLGLSRYLTKAKGGQCLIGGGKGQVPVP